MSRALRSPRRALAFVVLALSWAVVPVAVLGQTDEGATAPEPSSAILSQDGWWNRAQGRQEQEPETPLRPVIGGTVPAPSTVPANGLGVGALLGEADKVAAVGFVLDAPLDAFVDRLVLTLKESTAPNANANAATASIIACPITGFWASVKNGEFVSRPACDEGQSVPGTRGSDGTWTFDLALMATGWLDGTLPQNGVLLREAVEPPMSFQVSFGDLSTNTITLDFAASGGGFSGSSDFFSESFTFEETAPSADTGDFALSDSPSTFDGSTSSSFDDGGGSFSSTAPSPVSPTAGASAASPTPQVAAPAATTAASSPNLFGDLPVAALVFLALLVAATALFLGLVLGPLAAPVPATIRSGGVSRALADRQAASARP